MLEVIDTRRNIVVDEDISFQNTNHKPDLNFPLVFNHPCQQIRQPVSGQHHPPISDPACTNNVSHRKHGSRCDHRAVHVPTPWNPNPSPVAVGNLRCDLEALFCPRLEVGARQFGELAPLKLLAVSERRGVVS
jgi:hypothetical protein